MTSTLTALWTVALLLFATTHAAAAEPRRVLLLHAFGHAYSPWSDMASRFRAELIKQSPQPIDLYKVPLDAARAQDLQDDRPASRSATPPSRRMADACRSQRTLAAEASSSSRSSL